MPKQIKIWTEIQIILSSISFCLPTILFSLTKPIAYLSYCPAQQIFSCFALNVPQFLANRLFLDKEECFVIVNQQITFFHSLLLSQPEKETLS